MTLVSAAMIQKEKAATEYAAMYAVSAINVVPVSVMSATSAVDQYVPNAMNVGTVVAVTAVINWIAKEQFVKIVMNAVNAAIVAVVKSVLVPRPAVRRVVVMTIRIADITAIVDAMEQNARFVVNAAKQIVAEIVNVKSARKTTVAANFVPAAERVVSLVAEVPAYVATRLPVMD